MADTLLPFRVHFDDGSTFDVDATDAVAARKRATPIAESRDTFIKKTKLIREGQ